MPSLWPVRRVALHYHVPRVQFTGPLEVGFFFSTELVDFASWVVCGRWFWHLALATPDGGAHSYLSVVILVNLSVNVSEASWLDVVVDLGVRLPFGQALHGRVPHA